MFRILLLSPLMLVMAASASPTFPPLKRAPVRDEALPQGLAPRFVRGARIRFQPGQPTGQHRHPVPVVGVVTLGSFSFQLEGEAVRTLHRGESFYEPAGRRVVHFDNASSSRPAEIVAFYLAENRTGPLIEMLDGQAGR